MSLTFKFNIKRLHLFLAFLGLLALVSCESYRTALEEQYFQRGQAAFEKKDYTKALDFFSKAQKVSINNVSRYRMAEIYLIQDKFEESRKLINTLLRIERKNILAHELNILWYIKKNDREKVAQLYEELKSKNIRIGGRAYANAGVFYLNGGEYETALEFFRKADEAGEKSAEMFMAYLTTLQLYSRPEEAPKSSEPVQEGNGKSATKRADETEIFEEPVTTPISKLEDEQNLTQSHTRDKARITEMDQEETTQTDVVKQNEISNIQSISLNDEEEKKPVVDLREDIRLDMDRVVSMLAELYNKNEISTELFMQMADDLVNDEKFVHAFAFYKTVAEKKIDEKADKREEVSHGSAVDAATRVKAYRALINLIAKKQYHVTDEHTPLTILTYVKEIFKILFPRDETLIAEYTNSLHDLLKMEEITDVLKTKMRELYDEYGLVVKDEEIMSEDETEVESESNPS